jgi:hypothetical protein
MDRRVLLVDNAPAAFPPMTLLGTSKRLLRLMHIQAEHNHET